MSDELGGKTPNSETNGIRHRGNNMKTKAQNNAEFFSSLEKWLNDFRAYSYTCNFMSGFPYVMMSQQMNSSFVPPMNSPFINNNFLPGTPGEIPYGAFYTFPPTSQIPLEEPIEYRIPPLWKRFVAEVLDFLILFLIKLPITFIAVDFFDFVDLDKYDFDILQQQDKLDYKLALEMTSEILVLEIIHRIIVCIFEGIFLQKGATPGKSCMGIKVVLCTSVQQVENDPNLVKVYPATRLGPGWAFARALLKNLVIALLFPVCFPLFFNKFNRTGYDILCHCIVVEERPQPIRNR